MGLITETVNVVLHGNIKYYEELGYEIPRVENVCHKMVVPRGSKIEVKVEDLQEQSHTIVEYKCDGCGENFYTEYRVYLKHIKQEGKIYCEKCVKKLLNPQRMLKTKLKNGKSFYTWCIENDRQDVLNRWDYDKNNCSPKEILYSTNKKYWFRCDAHPEHSSELKNINGFTNGQEGSISCNQCNSIAQYILDTFPNKDLYDVLDKEKNGGLNPWNISRKSRKKLWFKCQEKDYHDSHSATCDRFVRGDGCPYCTNKNGKVHPKDSLGQYIIDNYGNDFLHNVWSDKNNMSPFELSPNSSKKVWWKCPEDRHEEYIRSCNRSFIYGFRCPKCSKERTESVIEEKVRLYLESLNYNLLHEHKCSLRPINPKTKHPMPYDNEIEELKLIIEVHGEQHYNYNFYKAINKCSDEEATKMLKQRKLYDRYKKAYALHYGYEYLEIPYTAFDKKETYKQMIDDKIEEILHNTKAS